jgi:O-antigen/teichoic acid export membrane protein
MTGALLINRAATSVLYVLIARHLGVSIFGQFSLVYTLYIIFQAPAIFGLTDLIVREVAKDKSNFGKYLINGQFIVLLSSLASLGLWVLTVHLLGYSLQVIRASYLLGLALIPFAMCMVCEAIFKAFERMQFIVYAFALANLAKIVLVWLLISQGFGLIQIVGLLVIIQGAILLIEWYFIYRYFSRFSWTIDLSFCRKLARVASTFLGISVFTMIFLRLNVIVLSKLQGDIEVGLYNAAFVLAYAFMFISMGIKEAVYPVLSRTYRDSLARFKQYVERSAEFLISLALPLSVGFFLLADSILLLVYKEEFVVAAPVMRFLGWMLVPLSFNRILGGALLATGQQRANLVITIVNSASLLVLSIVLIHKFGLIGAGMAALTSQVLSFALHYGVVSRRVFPISIARVSWKPVVSSLFLAGLLVLIREVCGLLMVMLLAAFLYSSVLIGLNFIFGGPLRLVSVSLFRGKLGSGVRETRP